MEQLIDIHCHILPAVDNGSVSMEQTRNMLKIAYEEGITYIIATPHYGAGCINPDKSELEEKLKKVRQAARELNPGFRIELGNELFYSSDITEHLRKGKAATLAGTRYCLVRFYREEEYEFMRAGLHSLLIQGYYPILSHAENYQCLYGNYEGIAQLINLGVYMQLNIKSLLGNPFDSRVRHARRLLRYEMVHFIGTGSRSDSIRAPMMKEGLRYIESYHGTEIKRQLIENTRGLLESKKIDRRLYPCFD
ncbi:CpsB/CapC family capsule biosynthesis tyrosine phosphatase [Anaerocolumna sp. AGMB13020]|uniref:CpsB/CapC family capsule biosynthesis tyrosine phosphatase n=1 Tax=Anaerocolumna sp. AGMB13020 TaxID=3081750 RepID=UPI002955D27C|nr:CpsB/CapC family capsule biosynthesis tyrosine phosphatase [Anaerocolumna sp. AGMB13020]WOO38843.1 CpsB/CapC family capsule biosynthesis tyrosine phosphatase [Anaerocolumna sp. AGMB13020]